VRRRVGQRLLICLGGNRLLLFRLLLGGQREDIVVVKFQGRCAADGGCGGREQRLRLSSKQLLSSHHIFAR